ncbi:MAG: cytochrome b/b6 domain-containing protein [Rhodobacteraceae bacterium]|nr:cytochrome b/b6 domain-containing protein [Paracoccaceae bacterium]
MSAPTGYSRTQILLHWGIFALIVLQFVLHDAMSEAWHALVRGQEIASNPLVAQHVFGGILVGLLVLWRLALRLRRGAPLPPEDEPAPLKLAAHVTHWSLYGLMLLLPVTGLMAWFGGVRAAAEVHEIFKALLMLLVGLHIAGALYHQFILKTDVLNRMRKAEL